MIGGDSKYKAMWTFAFFDLPMTTPKERREYMRFRKDLMRLGFSMMQLSVYTMYNPTREMAEALKVKVRRIVPPGGEVRLLQVTDRQFAKMDVLQKRKRRKPEKKPQQYSLL